MGKIHGIANHGVTGKIGAFVYAKGLGGETVVRNYTAKVKNPKTARQRISRQRLSIASKMAAALGSAIQVGYAKACAGLKMYPRNLFVKGIIPMDANIINLAHGEVEIEYSGIKVSKRDGIAELPTMGTATSSAAGKISVAVTAIPANPNPGAGEYGLVVVAYDPENERILMTQAVGTTAVTSGVELNGGEAWQSASAHVFAFLKWIPASGNDISDTTTPWKYPSATSDTVYVGVVNVA